MAFQMPYEDVHGNEYAESYWRVVQINISVPDRSGFFCLYGYKNQAARHANKQAIGQKTYTINGTDFDYYLTTHLEPGGPNIAEMTYNYAANCLDVSTENPENPEEKISFFDGATSV